MNILKYEFQDGRINCLEYGLICEQALADTIASLIETIIKREYILDSPRAMQLSNKEKAELIQKHKTQILSAIFSHHPNPKNDESVCIKNI